MDLLEHAEEQRARLLQRSRHQHAKGSPHLFAGLISGVEMEKHVGKKHFQAFLGTGRFIAITVSGQKFQSFS